MSSLLASLQNLLISVCGDTSTIVEAARAADFFGKGGDDVTIIMGEGNN